MDSYLAILGFCVAVLLIIGAAILWRRYSRGYLYICALSGHDIATLMSTGREPDAYCVIRGLRNEQYLLARRAERISGKLRAANIHDASFLGESGSAFEKLLEGEINGQGRASGKELALSLARGGSGRLPHYPKDLAALVAEWSADSTMWCQVVIKWAAHFAVQIHLDRYYSDR